MKVTAYWNDVEIHKKSAEVDIPQEVIDEGKSEIIGYIRDLIGTDAIEVSVDNKEIVEVFENISFI